MNTRFNEISDTNIIELGKIFSISIRFVYGSRKNDVRTEVSFK